MKTLNKEESEERTEAKRDMKMWLANDYELVEETPEFFLMKKNTATMGGHVMVFLLTFWFTMGLGNVAYYFLSVKKKKIIK